MSNGGSTRAIADEDAADHRSSPSPWLALVAAAATRRPSTPTGRRTAPAHVGDWRDEVIYQLLVDRFADGDLNNDYRVVPGALGALPGRRLAGRHRSPRLPESSASPTLWISPVVQNLETDADFDAYHGYWAQDLTQSTRTSAISAKLRELVAEGARARASRSSSTSSPTTWGRSSTTTSTSTASPTRTLRRRLRRAGAGRHAAVPDGAVITHLTEFDPDYDPRGVQGYTSLGFSGPAPIAGSTSRRSTARRRCRAPAPAGSVAAVRLSARRLVSPPRAHHRLRRARAGAHRRLPRRLRTRHRARRRARGDDGGVRALDPGGRLRRLPHRHAQARRARVLAVLRPRIRQYAAARSRCPIPPTRRSGKTVPPLTCRSRSSSCSARRSTATTSSSAATRRTRRSTRLLLLAEVQRLRRRLQDATSADAGRSHDQLDAQAQMNYAHGAATTTASACRAQHALVNFMDNHDVRALPLRQAGDGGAAQRARRSSSPRTGFPASITAPSRSSPAATIPRTARGSGTPAYDTDGATFAVDREAHQDSQGLRAAPPRRHDHQVVDDARRRRAGRGHVRLRAQRRRQEGAGGDQHLATPSTSETSAAQTGGATMLTTFARRHELVDVLAAPMTRPHVHRRLRRRAQGARAGARRAHPRARSRRGAAAVAVASHGAARDRPRRQGPRRDARPGRRVARRRRRRAARARRPVGLRQVDAAALHRRAEQPTRGAIRIDGVDVTRAEPRDRDIAMVFQSYALYPHLTVRENLAFGLKMRKTPKAEIDARVGEAAEMLGLDAAARPAAASSSRADSGSAWRWGAPSCGGPRSSSSTSRSRTSTRRCAGRCASS